MKKTIKLLFLSVCTLGALSACSEDELDPNSIFVDSEISLTPLEKYIEREYTKPYNIAILYKYVDIESNMNYNLSPATYDASVRITKLMQYLAIEPYNDVTGGKEFIRDNFPKLLNYVGSPAYNNNGTMILGTAEGGRKITLFNLNALTPARAVNKQYLLDMYFRTIHHEFAHIFHQTKPYTASFNQISGTKYVQDQWNVEYNNTTALQNGFISPYASKDANEDFVELISFYILLSEAEWDARMTTAGANGRAIINEKFDIVRNYMDVSWNIDLDELRDNIQGRLDNLASFDQTNID